MNAIRSTSERYLHLAAIAQRRDASRADAGFTNTHNGQSSILSQGPMRLTHAESMLNNSSQESLNNAQVIVRIQEKLSRVS